MVEIVGVDHVCVGTGTKMATPAKPNLTENKLVRVGE
jgi:hypothetical protein